MMLPTITVATKVRLGWLVQLATAAGVAWWLHQHPQWQQWQLGWSVAIAIGVASPFAVHLLILALDFGLARAVGGRVAPEHRLGLVGALRCFWGEAKVSIRAFHWDQGARHTTPDPQPGDFGSDAHRVPVLLVHGYMCNRAIWLPMAQWLAKRGHPVASITLDPPFGSIDDYPLLIDAAVSRLLASTRRHRCAIIAHSMGGLATRAYMRQFGDDKISHVVTLGTPHQGTVHARAGLGFNARQMERVGDQPSPWILGLASTESAARRAKITTIITHQDNIVAPQAVQTLEGSKAIAIHGYGHLALCYAPQVWELAAQELDAS